MEQEIPPHTPGIAQPEGMLRILVRFDYSIVFFLKQAIAEESGERQMRHHGHPDIGLGE